MTCTRVKKLYAAEKNVQLLRALTEKSQEKLEKFLSVTCLFSIPEIIQ